MLAVIDVTVELNITTLYARVVCDLDDHAREHGTKAICTVNEQN